jgi:ketosteroid isomerase-like protein
MKIPLVVALVALAISFTLPTFAQQREPTASQQDRQQLDALIEKFDEAWNNNDAAALAALYAEDAVIVRNTGPIYGREAIEKMYTDLFQKVHFSNHIAKADQFSPHIIGTAGNEAWSNGEWSTTLKGQNFGPIQLKGYWSNITVRDGDTWKDRMEIANTTPAPAATPSPTVSPTNQ